MPEVPPTLEYEAPRPPKRHRFAAAAWVCRLGLLAVVAGIVVVIAAVDGPYADQAVVLFGAILGCFGVTWFVLGLILREAMRR